MKIKGLFTLQNLLSVVVVLVSVLAIGYVNYLIIRFQFQGELSAYMGSIEISYIQMAKFWQEGGGLWQPLWYLGYPWHVFYTPVLPFLELVFHNLWDFSFSHAYRVITAASYILTPISLYLFIWQISKSKAGALVGAFFYTLIPSVIGLLFKRVAQDTLSGMLEPRRFTILVRWGEGPHTVALVFLPLFGFFTSRYLREGKLAYLVLASVFLGLCAMTNAIVMWAAVLMCLAFLLAEATKKSSEIVATLKKLFTIGLCSFGLIAFWYNLPFLGTFFAEGSGALSNWLALFPFGLIPLLGIVILIIYLMRRFLPSLAGINVSIFWFLMLFSLVFVYYLSGDAKIEYVPQVLRLNTEVDMALSVLIGVLASNLFLILWRLKANLRIPGMILSCVGVLLSLVAIYAVGKPSFTKMPEFAKPLEESRLKSVENSVEYRVAKKVENLTQGGDERVFVSGNYGFWLNYFVNTPQLRGALYQSSTHTWPDHIYYQVTNGSDGNITLAWLKIANIGKFVFTTLESGEPFKDFKVPRQKFDSTLSALSEENGDIFYDVPLKNRSLAKVVDEKRVRDLKKPLNAIDEEAIYKYLAWIEAKSDKQIKVEKISNDRIKLSGEVGEGEAILYQGTYDTGWRINKSGWNISKDPLDFMLIKTKKIGKFEVELVYGKPLAVYLGYLVTLATIGLLAETGWKQMASKQLATGSHGRL